MRYYLVSCLLVKGTLFKLYSTMITSIQDAYIYVFLIIHYWRQQIVYFLLIIRNNAAKVHFENEDSNITHTKTVIYLFQPFIFDLLDYARNVIFIEGFSEVIAFMWVLYPLALGKITCYPITPNISRNIYVEPCQWSIFPNKRMRWKCLTIHSFIIISIIMAITISNNAISI